MNEPMDTPTIRAGAGAQRLDERGGVGDHGLRRESVGVLGGTDPAVVEGDDPVSGRQERRNLMRLPGASGAAAAGDENDGLTGPAIVVCQVNHPHDGTSSG